LLVQKREEVRAGGVAQENSHFPVQSGSISGTGGHSFWGTLDNTGPEERGHGIPDPHAFETEL
jgi:hypothetical protein